MNTEENRDLNNQQSSHQNGHCVLITRLKITRFLVVEVKGVQPGSQGLCGVRVAACDDQKMKFNNLFHHFTLDLLRHSFFALKKTAAPGVDGETWRDYERDFERRIVDLHGRLHRAAYRAKPSQRTYIPKADGKMRPLGIAALEDKIVQYAAKVILEWADSGFVGFWGSGVAGIPESL